MSSKAEVDAAILGLHDSELGGKRISVTHSISSEDRKQKLQ
jgi:hypothetical protein